MLERRLSELGDRYGLTAEQVGQLGSLLDLLATDDNAPTTVREPAAAIEVHIADSLTGLLCPELRQARMVADLGAGAGFPSLALAACLADATVYAVESARRKADFIAGAAERANLTNVEVVWARAEEWDAGTGRCDVVTARALASLGVLCEYAAPLLRPDGVLIAWKGAVDATEASDAAAACQRLGMRADRELPVEPFPSSERRRLVVIRKVTETPSGFPRRAGMAVKKPLRAAARGARPDGEPGSRAGGDRSRESSRPQNTVSSAASTAP